MENPNLEIKDDVMLSPDQLTMLDGTDSNATPSVAETTTQLEIGHEPVSSVSTPVTETTHPEIANEEDGVSGNTKLKVLSALAIVAVAGYIAYWVQEPVQLKADLLGGSESTAVVNPTVPTSSAVVAATTETEGSVTPVVTETAGPSKNIDISLFGFEPAALQVDKGTTVIWTNTSSEDQTLIGASKNSDSFTSPVMTSGATFTKKFDKDGEYTYYSTYNPALKANINVGLGSALPVVSTDVASAVNETALTEAINSTIPTAIDTSTTDLKAAADSMSDSSALVETTDLKSSAMESPQKLSKTGPEDYLYLLLFGLIAYFNRRKLAAVFAK